MTQHVAEIKERLSAVIFQNFRGLPLCFKNCVTGRRKIPYTSPEFLSSFYLSHPYILKVYGYTSVPLPFREIDMIAYHNAGLDILKHMILEGSNF